MGRTTTLFGHSHSQCWAEPRGFEAGFVTSDIGVRTRDLGPCPTSFLANLELNPHSLEILSNQLGDIFGGRFAGEVNCDSDPQCKTLGWSWLVCMEQAELPGLHDLKGR